MTPAATNMDALLSTQTVRKLLDVSDRCLRRWVAAGKFPPADMQIGRTLRWKQSTVTEFIEHGPENGSTNGMSPESKQSVRDHDTRKHLTK